MTTDESTELTDIFKEFYRNYYRDEIGELAQKYPTDKKSLHIDWEDLYRFNPDLADDFRNKPQRLQDYAEEALRLYDLPIDIKLGQAHVRVRNLPEATPISELRHEHHGRLIAVQGAVREMTDVSPKVTNAAFECQRCGTLTRIPNLGGDLDEPHECHGCERKGPFRLNMDQSEFIDTQRLRIQELPGSYNESDTPPQIEIHIEDDLAGQVSVGDRVTVTAVLKLDQRGSKQNPSSRFDMYLEGVDIEDAYDTYPEVEIASEDEQKINELASRDDLFNLFVESLAPSVEGHEHLKEAIILQLFGGITKEFPDGAVSRGNIHTLVVSDPGKAISRLIDRSSRFAPRAVSISGTDTSKAAMTAPATASSNAPGDDPWEIKAGVTVMADQGLLCLDNLEALGEGARSALASVLEEQQVKASKASQKKTFPARASVLAAGRPKYGRFDQFEPVGEQINVTPQLLSSFDLIFVSTDSPGDDEETADHILDISQAVEYSSDSRGLLGDDDIDPSTEYEEYEPEIEEEELRKYIVYAKENCNPTMTEAAKESLNDFYTTIRSRAEDELNSMPVSARKLESMIRLAEASARTRLSSTVEEQDTERVVNIVRSNLEDIGMDPEPGESNGTIVETGTSKSQRDRIQNIKGIINDIENEFNNGAPIDIVIERAEEAGIDKAKAEHEIEQLKQKGEVFEPRTDHLMST